MLSKQLLDAIKSKEVHVDCAKAMCDFFIKKYEEDETHLFKLITVDDMELIMKNFSGLTVNTLEGQCTRSLHQIKCSDKSGVLLQRPFSCCCKFCKDNECCKCDQIEYTGGSFQLCKLPSSDACKTVEEEDEEDSYDGDLFVDNHLDEDDEVQIEIVQDDLSIENLNIQDFVVVALPVGSNRNRYSHWVFKISGKDEEDKLVFGRFFKPEFDRPDIFHQTNEDEGEVDLDQVIMVLPDPHVSRGSHIFPGHLKLRNNLEF